MTAEELYDNVTRRSVLKTGAVTAGLATVGAAGAAANKRGGRAQVDGTIHRNEPWRLSSSPTGTDRNASCMSAESAPQTYLQYDIEYCNREDSATLYVIPDEAALAQQEVYEFRSVRPCRASDLEKVAFGPSNQDCG